MEFRLGDYVPYLVNKAGVSIANTVSRELDRFGITLPMWRVMSALLDEGEMRLGDLARLTAIELSTLSRVAASMERGGLVTRRRSDDDARAVMIGLSDEGLRVTKDIVPRALLCETTVTAGMSKDEIRLLKCLLQRLCGEMGTEDSIAP